MSKRNAFLNTVLRSASVVALLAASTPALHAQQRFLLPEGMVLTARTNEALNSATTTVGTTFTTTVTDPVLVDGYTVIPQGSTIEGRVTFVRPATSRQSGVIGVDFTRLTLPNGGSIAIDGKLTSTNPEERRQIETQANAQVVFVGGRQGTGAAIGGISGGSASDPLSGFLGALSTMLSRGADVTVPPNTTLAVQLERGLTLAGLGGAQRNDATDLYTSTDMIRQAQTALRTQNYYRGAVNGVLNNATQRALFEYQIDHNILATGNLDARTAHALGVQVASGGVGSGSGGSALALSISEAAQMRRNAQMLTSRWRTQIGITEAGRLDQGRGYRAAEIELLYALSAFADNASQYEQMVRANGTTDAMATVGQALVSAARRVDAALTAAGAGRLNGWRAIVDQLAVLDPDYR
jgi:hypothetical protein